MSVGPVTPSLPTLHHSFPIQQRMMGWAMVVVDNQKMKEAASLHLPHLNCNNIFSKIFLFLNILTILHTYNMYIHTLVFFLYHKLKSLQKSLQK